MFEIGPLEPHDLPAALRLSTQAGWNQLETDWARLVALWPDHCLAGRRNGVLVATATLATYPPDVGWVGMVLVDATCRGQGLGGAMMDAILAAADRAGITRVGLDATDLGRPIYVKRGFVDAIGIDRRVLAAADRPADDAATAESEPLREADWPSLLALDRELFGADRSRVLRRLRDERGNRCYIVRDGHHLVGYGLRRPGRASDQVGPVVARSGRIATALIRSLTARGERSCDVLLDTSRGGESDAWLEGARFIVSRRLTRMFRGGASLPHRHTYAAAGLELG